MNPGTPNTSARDGNRRCELLTVSCNHVMGYVIGNWPRTEPEKTVTPSHSPVWQAIGQVCMGLADPCQIGTQASKKMTFGLSALPGSSYSNRGPKTEFIHKNRLIRISRALSSRFGGYLLCI